MKLLNGKNLAKKIEGQLKREIARLPAKGGKPGLAVILVGQNLSSKIYIKIKEKKAKELGIRLKKYLFPGQASQKKIIDLIKKLNQEKNINGIIVQLPLPKHLNADKIVNSISIKKDVDGFRKNSPFISPVHQAILLLLKSTKKNLTGKKALIIANSKIFSQPLVKLLKKEKVKTKIHLSKQKELKEKARQSDILIVAQGRPQFIKKDIVKKGAIIIDVGYNRIRGKVVGDVDRESVAEKADFLSPVPGGVGPLTVIFLLKNVVRASKTGRDLEI